MIEVLISSFLPHVPVVDWHALGRSLLSPWTVLTWATVLIVLLFLYSRTRLPVLYLVKSLWVVLTVVAFLWVVITSMGSNRQYVQFPARAVSQFLVAGSPVARDLGVAVLLVMGLLVLAGRLLPRAAPPSRRRRFCTWLCCSTLLGGLATLRVLAIFLPRVSDWLSPWPVTLTTLAGELVLALVLIATATFSRPVQWGRKRAGILRTLRVALAVLAVAGLAAAARSPGRHAAFIAGVSVGAVVILMMGLGELMPTRTLQVGRKRLVLGIRSVLGVAAAATLLVAAHYNGYDRWYENYATALLVARMGEYAVNSLLITIGAVVTTICVASLAAFALTKLDFFGRDAFLYTFIAGFAIPGQLILVPLFLMMRHWTIPDIGFSFMDSRFGLILIYAATGLPFSIFLLTGFFASLPSELGEAAAIDGCGEFATFRKVYFPLAMPGLTTAGIFNFLGVWNEYNFALVFITNPKLKTLPVGLYVLNVSQQYAANWPALFSGIVILWAPTFLIFLVLQKQIIAGLTLGSVKG